MQPFYLTLNEDHYYRVTFVDQRTGLVTCSKSTHKKDKNEATLIAYGWYKDGVPTTHANSLKSNQDFVYSSGLNLEHIVSRLSQSEAVALVSLISAKFNINQNAISTSVSCNFTVPVTSALPKKNLPKKIAVPRKKTAIIAKDSCSSFSNQINKSLSLSPYLCKFLDQFWNPDISEYVKKKRAHGKSCGDRHCKDMRDIVRRYWIPYFGDDCLISDVDENTLDDFFFELKDLRNLSGRTVNHCISCAKVAFEFLAKKGFIAVDPMAHIERYGMSDAKERGIPTETEVKQLLNHHWKNYVSYLAFNLSAFSGLRPGEISALQVRDIDLEADIIHVRHACERGGKLKCPKNGEARDVPVSHEVALMLIERARTNPFYARDSFVFFSEANNYKPFLPQYYDKGFYEAMCDIGISEEERAERNIVFYSLRHFCATILSQRADLKTVQAVLGHKTIAMTEHYSNHESLEQLRKMKQIVNDGREFVATFTA